MNINKIKYNRLNNILYKTLQHIACIKNVKHIKLHSRTKYITYNSPVTEITMLNKPSTYMKVNYKELCKIKKKLTSGYLLLSTSLGVLTDTKALLCKIGGTILCYIKS